MKKRVISMILALCLCATLLPTTAQAWSIDYNDFKSIYSKEPVVFHVSGYVMAALKSDNSLWTWGLNYDGAVGNGKGFYTYYDPKQNREIDAFVDTPYQTLDHVKTYEGGTWAIKEDDSLWVWGETAVLLGVSDNALTAVPQKYMDDVLSFSYGASPETPYQSPPRETPAEYNMYVVKTDGSLWAWGKNSYGELGDGTTQERATPVKIMDGVRYVRYVQGHGPGMIAPYPGYGHVFVLKEDDSLWGWGADAERMNDAKYGVSTTTPEKHLDHVKSICNSDQTVAAITKDGNLYLWGRVLGAVEGLGHSIIDLGPNQGSSGGPDYYYVNSFYPVAGDVREVHLPGALEIIYVTNSDEVYNWGYNNKGYHKTPTKLMDGVSTVVKNLETMYLCKTNGDVP